MKTPRVPFPGRFLAVSLLLSAGCSREKPETNTATASKPPPGPTTLPTAGPGGPAPVTPVPAAADPFAEMSTALEGATFEQHDGLAGIQQRLDQAIDAQVAAKKAGADVDITADQKLDAATNDFAEKLRMLSVARAETWSTAKHNATQALQGVRDAYANVMASPARH